ncbi:hypothetical protein AWY96_01370 [Serratia plymuthica]|uniref:thiamine pyrophosphate-binding protein n=1 Tax=Serratia plymuthica TaxID=82996 RepID=UPI00079FDFA0|nr:thiamine pyrophosphate-binding protein [Serratia plymuthica]KYQ97220.1 hypothetical protein AWY96_01370 [Serratia plymuthica]
MKETKTHRIERYGSDVFLDVIKAYGIKYVFFNPGATTRGLHDSLINDAELTLVLCMHEESAVAMAHGYAKMTGKPAVVLLHANVGLLNASMGIFNAYVDRVPMLILNGLGPSAVEKRRPWIDWIHTNTSQASMMKDYVRWYDQPTSLESAIQSVERALILTEAKPCCPTLVTIDAALQEQSTEIDFRFTPGKSLISPQASEHYLIILAELIINSNYPIFIANQLGRYDGAVAVITLLCERLSIPIVDMGDAYNFPNGNNLYITENYKSYLRKSDLIISLENTELQSVIFELQEDKYQPIFNSDAKIVKIGMGESFIRSETCDYFELQNTYLNIIGEIRSSLSRLSEILFSDSDSSTTHKRKNARELILYEIKTTEKPVALQTPFHEAIRGFWNIIKDEDWILVNEPSIIYGKEIRKIWKFSDKHIHLGNSGGCGLGYGVGASIGAAFGIEDKNKIIISFIGDGDLNFSSSTLWTASHYKLPIIFIVVNNQGYYNTKTHSTYISKIRNRELKREFTGNEIIDPEVNYEHLASAYGIKFIGTATDLKSSEDILFKAISFMNDCHSPSLIELVI